MVDICRRVAVVSIRDNGIVVVNQNGIKNKNRIQ
jgi:hypothetical protein